MNRFLHYLKGYVQIRIKCQHPERFMRLCSFHGIRLFHVVPAGAYYEMEIELDSFFKLQPVCRKERSHVHIIKKTGLPFFFLKQRKRKAFFVGILFGLFLLLLASTRVWNIHIEGNERYPTGNLIQALAKTGVEHGTAKSKIKTQQVAAFLREEFPEILWVSAQIKGTRFLLTIQENKNSMVTPNPAGETSWDLVAEESGIIVSVLVRKGVALVHSGEQCQKGDVLISGTLPLFDDNKEMIRQQLVMADGDVYMQRSVSYENSFPLKYPREHETGRSKTAYGIQIGTVLCNLDFGKNSFQHYNSFSDYHELRLTENFYLPIWMKIKHTKEYEIIETCYSKKEAESIAEKQIRKFMNQLSEKGMKILKNNVKITIRDGNCVSDGSILVLHKTGRKTKISVQEQTERTLVNE